MPGSLTLVAARWPVVMGALDAAPRSRIERAGIPARLCVNGIQISSAYDPGAEAALQARTVGVAQRDAMVFGLGLGHLPRALLARPALERLQVVLLALGADRAALERDAGGDWLNDPRLTFVRAEDADVPRANFAVVPSALALAEPGAFPLRDALVSALNSSFAAAYWQGRHTELSARIVAHAGEFASDGDVASFFGRAVGRTVLVCGGGPTLTAGLSWLVARREATPVVAVTTALRPLASVGRVPDVAVALDQELALLDHLTGLDREWLAAIPLVHAPVVCPEFLRAWPGPRYVFHPRRPLYDSIAERVPRGRLHAEGTVAHVAMDLAVRMGAAHVVFAGLDFAYTFGRTHAQGAAHEASAGVHRGARLPLENGRGELVLSDVNLIGYLRATEAFIASHPDVRFSVVSLDGARIRGTALVAAEGQ